MTITKKSGKHYVRHTKKHWTGVSTLLGLISSVYYIYIYIYIFTNLISTSIHGTRKKRTKTARNKR